MKAVIKRMHNANLKRGGSGFIDPKIDDRMVTPHGFRSTFKTWAAEIMHYDDDISEAALAHKDKNKVRAAYRRTTFFEKRRALMNDYASFCLPEKVK
jgi:integrase